MTREEAIELLHVMVASPSLRRHCRAVAEVMAASVLRYGASSVENPDDWWCAGVLHDADYERHSNEHPRIIVELLLNRGEQTIAYAVSAHGSTWGVPWTSPMSRALIGCDELVGLITACACVRPEGIRTLTVPSVLRKLKDKRFAAGVDRAEVYAGIEILCVRLEEHAAFIIGVLNEHADDLGLLGDQPAG